mgnify:CR=1 FL=1
MHVRLQRRRSSSVLPLMAQASRTLSALIQTVSGTLCESMRVFVWRVLCARCGEHASAHENRRKSPTHARTPSPHRCPHLHTCAAVIAWQLPVSPVNASLRVRLCAASLHRRAVLSGGCCSASCLVEGVGEVGDASGGETHERING